MIGLRADEPLRINRVAERDASASGFEGEHVYMPLGDMGVTRDDVNAFWAEQAWDLALPQDASLSNCVFCFLKGAANLAAIRARMEGEKATEAEGFGPLANSPCDLAWWERIESTYSRDLIAEGRTPRGSITRIGFFGGDGVSYRAMREGIDLNEHAETMLPCDCTE